MEPQSQAGVFLGWLSAQFVNDDAAQIGIKILYFKKVSSFHNKNVKINKKIFRLFGT